MHSYTTLFPGPPSTPHPVENTRPPRTQKRKPLPSIVERDSQSTLQSHTSALNATGPRITSLKIQPRELALQELNESDAKDTSSADKGTDSSGGKENHGIRHLLQDVQDALSQAFRYGHQRNRHQPLSGQESATNSPRHILPALPLSPLALNIPAPQTIRPTSPSKPSNSVHPHAATPSPPLRDRDDGSTRYTFDGVPLFRQDAPSLQDYDCGLDVSFCNSVSTSYSGPVLGIDVDIQHLGEPTKDSRDQSPLPLSLEVDVGVLGSREELGAEKPMAEREITSAVLPVLLPVAAAEGIVHLHGEGRDLAFHSPTGNLIHPYPSEYSCDAELSSCLAKNSSTPPARRVLSAGAYPTSTAAVPGRLHRRASSCPHCIDGGTVKGKASSVKGCHGVYRKKSAPRFDSGMRKQVPRNRLYKPIPKREGYELRSQKPKAKTGDGKEGDEKWWMDWGLGMCCLPQGEVGTGKGGAEG